MRTSTILVAAVFAISCGGSKSQPAAPTSRSQDAAGWVLAGQVVDSVTGTTVAGAQVTIDGRGPFVTDSDGRWRTSGDGTAEPRLSTTVLAAGYVPRETFVNWRPEGRHDIVIELLPERAPFALSFYRFLVRNGLEEPTSLQPLRRWTANPNFYVQTRNPQTGRALEATELDLIVNAIRETVPQLTGGALSAGAIETGEAPRAPQLGYINVRIVNETSEIFCGRALVGENPGDIELNYDRCTTACRGISPSKIPPAAVAHEVGHALGFWHVDRGLMAAYMSSDCANSQFTEPERLHARIAYRRPSGNSDPDRDPTNFAAALTDGASRITCALASR